MNVSLSSDLLDFVRKKVESGDFPSNLATTPRQEIGMVSPELCGVPGTRLADSRDADWTCEESNLR